MEFKDYERIGSELKELNNRVVDYIIEMSKKYGKSKPQVKHGDKAMKALTTLRSELENMMYIEHPEECKKLGEKALHVFYGSSEKP